MNVILPFPTWGQNFGKVQENNVMLVWLTLSFQPNLTVRFIFVLRLLLITYEKLSKHEPCFRDHRIYCGPFKIMMSGAWRPPLEPGLT